MAEPQKSSKPEESQASQAPQIETANKESKSLFDGATYSRVRFSHKSNDSDPVDVKLSVQGFVVTCQRGVETVVPDFILKAADHATYPKFTVRPGEGRKVAGIIRKFPYERLGKATAAEFLKAIREGSEKTRKLVEKHGLNIPVEQAIPQDV